MTPRAGGGMRRNMLTLNISDEQTLYNSYLPFLKYGGLFIPTDKAYKLGEEVFLLLTLPNEGEKIALAGKVVWINPKGVQGRRPAGIGIHFGEDKKDVRHRIEKGLGALIKSEKNTYSM